MATDTVTASADGFIADGEPGTAYGSGEMIVSVAPADGGVRGGLTFDLSVANGRTRVAASFALRREDTGATATMEYRRKSPAYAETDTWTSSNAHQTTPTASASYPTGTDASGSRTTVINNADFLAMVDDACNNRSGILSFFMQYAAGTASGVYAIASDRENATANNRPVVIVEHYAKPALTPTVADLEYVEGAGAQAVDDAIVVDSDSGTATIASATIAITDGFNNKGATDVLAMTESISGITPSYDDETGILTLSVTAGRLAYQAALRAVTFETDDTAPATREITFTVTDTYGGVSTSVTRDIEITEPAAGGGGGRWRTALRMLLEML